MFNKLLISSILVVLIFDGCGKPKNLVERNGVWYEVNSQEPYTGDYTLTKSAEVNGEEKKWTAAEGYIRNGKFDGDFTFMGLDGSKATSTFKNGVQNGIYKEFSNNGQLIEESSYVDGKRNGKSKAFWANGQKKYDCEYKNGEIKSSCLEYDENGQIAKKKELLNDKIIRETKYVTNSFFTIRDVSLLTSQPVYRAEYSNANCKTLEEYFNPQNGKTTLKMHIHENTSYYGKDGDYLITTYYDDKGYVDFENQELGSCITKPAKAFDVAKKIIKDRETYFLLHGN